MCRFDPHAFTFSVISAEMGKYRKMVKSSSMMFAVYFNPKIGRVGADAFVPREPSGEAEDEISADALDRALRQFQREG